MKKFFTICLLAVLPILFLASCSDDDDSSNVSELVGVWIEDTSSTKEVLHLALKDDGTGRFYVSNDGTIDGNGLVSITWFATDNEFSMKKEGGKVETFSYFLSGGKLHIGEIVYRRF